MLLLKMVAATTPCFGSKKLSKLHRRRERQPGVEKGVLEGSDMPETHLNKSFKKINIKMYNMFIGLF